MLVANSDPNCRHIPGILIDQPFGICLNIQIHFPASRQSVGGKNDDRRVFVKRGVISPYQTQSLYSVRIGHHMIEKYQIITPRPAHLNSLKTAVTQIGYDTHALEEQLDDL